MNIGARRWAGLRFIGTFIAVFAVLQFGMLKSEGTAVERALIDHATVGVAAALTALVFPQDGVRANGPTLASSRVRLNVLQGCEGTDLLFLVIAAGLAFPAGWRDRLLVLAGGTALAYALNQLRILALYYTVRDARQHFELVHAYLAPTLLIVAIALFFWWWTVRSGFAAPGKSTAAAGR
jgi:exosortase family protein XrtM